MDSVERLPPAGLAVPGGLARRLLDDLPYAAMLTLALVGVVLRLPVVYWVILTPVFGIISIAQGWSHFANRAERLGLACRLALDWCAVLLAIYLLYNGGVQGVLNANATSLAMMTLLALGTFVAGVQARVWQICTIGGVLFAAVPGLGWLDQSPLLLTFAACVIVVLVGGAWWITRRTARHQRACIGRAVTVRLREVLAPRGVTKSSSKRRSYFNERRDRRDGWLRRGSGDGRIECDRSGLGAACARHARVRYCRLACCGRSRTDLRFSSRPR